MRLDQFLVQQGVAASREHAKSLILKGQFGLGLKPSLQVTNNLAQELQRLESQPKRFVGRAGAKLWGFLEQHPLGCQNKVVLDVGSSTGGFAQVLLEKGAKRVVCVDVGQGQLAKELRENPKIELHESCDIRVFQASHIYDLLVCDVSFISLRLLLATLIPLSPKLLLLFKPQFEVGLGVRRNKKGVVLDKQAIDKSLAEFLSLAENLGLKTRCVCESTLKGKEGNVEMFILLERG
ncbi:RNA binding methyltransferase FtsJ like [Helicobacter heilmannii]|uniref:RNA binding methyltransferase FtsJ like n=1 Tax=Helicobacter heilmannii TaxID=35817 RepID=A0A0K2XMH5_HELHE|nr:TlyA family RNA methyltransferase [Helicobacter heilmannii]CCM11999.1 RNA binding methyltransferase FtsJ like [Helicobacter heilmannii ASB1.4]CRF45980.1 RNA binding methyltransferase FtsJ like [Helicobacter heilmannii]CRF48150.1 RNA binding methyltransferase FtsJ like [Helicobacter heilmannii]CRF48475.1 RNA binding methyltransferase FtsJ like [Helicobacter heilmannii]CRF51348.1 RNA binding methyltransferase FtsJ like [Helicobacter heilmannii]